MNDWNAFSEEDEATWPPQDGRLYEVKGDKYGGRYAFCWQGTAMFWGLWGVTHWKESESN